MVVVDLALILVDPYPYLQVLKMVEVSPLEASLKVVHQDQDQDRHHLAVVVVVVVAAVVVA